MLCRAIKHCEEQATACFSEQYKYPEESMAWSFLELHAKLWILLAEIYRAINLTIQR